MSNLDEKEKIIVGLAAKIVQEAQKVVPDKKRVYDCAKGIELLALLGIEFLAANKKIYLDLLAN